MQGRPRTIGFKTIFDLLKQRRTHFSITVVFTLMPLVFISIFTMVSTINDAGIPEADYQKIQEEGQLTAATITDIEEQTNISINEEHPSIISYVYSTGQDEAVGIYRSLDPKKIGQLKIGDAIQIQYLDEHSMIVGLEPFEFPFEAQIILMPFLTIGFFLAILLYLRIRKILSLYKYGVVKSAELIAMNVQRGLPISGIGQGATVHYQYETTSGTKGLGKSFTNDHSLLNSMKQGDMINIFVSETNESNSCLIPKIDQLRNNWEIEINSSRND